jgi:proteasome lid subunit RPN8/RPN11
MRRKSKESVFLNTYAWKTVLRDAYQRQNVEACGALLGSRDAEGNWHIEEAYPLRNTHNSPVYFEFDPSELLMIDLEQPGRMVGVYHSHPTAAAVASKTDRQNMQRVNIEQQIPWVWLIVGGPFIGAPPAITEATVDGAETRAFIADVGVVAYYHYRERGLQKIAIQSVQKEDTERP